MRFSKSLIALSAQSSIALGQTNGTNTTTEEAYWALSTDSHFSSTFYEALALANNGGSATGEVLRAAAKIVPGDEESFHNEFMFLADSIHSVAESVNSTKNPVSARQAYFRASSYYRLASFYLTANVSDPRLYSVWDSALADFDKAAALSPAKGERFNITGPGFDIPIIYWKSPYAADKACVPTVLVGSGYDAAQEDSYHSIGREILERGWNFVTYEGPGQPTVRRQQGLGFIPNWWDVVTPVVDFLESRPEVDKKRIALVGMSFGGILAPLAATREHRFAAVLAIDGLQNLQTIALGQFPATISQLYTSGNKTAFDAYLNAARVSSQASTLIKWFVGQGLWAFNTQSPYDWFTRLGDINLNGTKLNNITSPVFVGKGQDDTTAGGQEQTVAKLLGDKAYFHEFKTALGAGEHCQLGAEPQLAQVSLDWLTEVFEAVA